MKNLAAVIILLSIISAKGFSQVPDWSTKVATIIYDNCSVCHHEGAIAPFPLMSYDDAITYGFSIQEQVNAKKMPPWPPDPNYNHLRDEKVLSDDDILAINEWVDGGVPLGDTLLAPDPPFFNANSLLMEIDDTVRCPDFTVPYQPQADVYRTFVMHSDYTETVYLNEIEFVPGDPSIVHHIFLFTDTSDISWQVDADDPGPGFAGGGQGGFSPYSVYITGWTPGSDPVRLPYNMGFEVLPGTDFAIEIHYAPGSTGKTDSTKMHLKFSDAPVVRPLYSERLLYWHPPSLINGPLTIPANTVKTFYEKSDSFLTDKSLIQFQPHSHLICRSWKVYMVTAPGDTTNLVYIPNWDFEWQMGYYVTKVIKVPMHAQFFGEAFFDNTTNNPDNPSDPPENVTSGQKTTDEMMACRFTMMEYQPGDEDIILDSAFYGLPTSGEHVTLSDLQVEVFPNPANETLHFVTSLPEHHVTWTLLNQMGMVVMTEQKMSVPKGVFVKDVNVSELPAGVYYLILTSGLETTAKKIIVSR